VDVVLEAVALAVEFDPLDVADEAHIGHVLLLPSLLLAQLRERVDDDTKHNVQQHRQQDDVEQRIVAGVTTTQQSTKV